MNIKGVTPIANNDNIDGWDSPHKPNEWYITSFILNLY